MRWVVGMADGPYWVKVDNRI